jgi:hypothetical protein
LRRSSDGVLTSREHSSLVIERRPAGEIATDPKAAKVTSTRTRAERKAETRIAVKSGSLPSIGETGTDPRPTKLTSNKTRAARKAETRAAAKAGLLPPAGEGDRRTK